MTALPSHAEIEQAILHAPAQVAGFPLANLREPTRIAQMWTQPHLYHLFAQIDAEAERAVTTPIPELPYAIFRLFEVTGDRATYEARYFDRRRRLAALTLCQFLPQDDPVQADVRWQKLADLLWEICNEYTWALPAHIPAGIDAVRANRLPPEQTVDLFAAETAAALAEVLALLGDRLDPWLDYRIRSEIERRIFVPYFANEEPFWWESAPMNWASVCAGSAGIAALVLVEDRPRLARMIVRVLRALEAFLSGFASDGGTPEGIAYWEYGFGFYTYFAEALREYTGGAIDLLVGPQIQRIAVFPNAVALGEDHFVNFSDANPTARMHAGLCAHLAERTGVVMPPLPQPDFATDHIFRWAHISRDLLWSKPSGTAPLADGSFFLRDLAWVIDRRTVDGKMLAFAAKGGHNDEPHNHNDLGHFILHVGGESLLADVGAGRYTRQYFGAERYESIHSGAQGHSVPGIGGMLQQAGREYEAHTLTYGTRSDGVDFALDLTDAYALPALRHFARHFDWRVDPQHHSATLTLTDVLEAVEPVTLDERLVSFQAPVLCTSGDEGAVIWRGAQGEVTLHYDARQFSAEIAPATTSDHFGAPLAIYVLLLHANNPLPQQRVVLQFTCQLQ